MNGHAVSLLDTQLTTMPSGALWWADRGLLCVSDLHLGKSDRIARRTGTMVPPYETRDTLSRLSRDVAETGAATVLCLGDSFDDLAAAQAMSDADRNSLAQLQRGRDWIWIEGNHDPGPNGLGGDHQDEVRIGPLTFRHIAMPAAMGEVSGHYHPKARVVIRGRMIARPCFLADATRMILPAYGTYTGGLAWTDAAFAPLLAVDARAFLTGRTITALPVPRRIAAE